MSEPEEISPRAATPEELRVIAEARDQFKIRWKWGWEFAADRHPNVVTRATDDILAIDYLEYESVQVPLLEATLICTDVLRHAAGLMWVRNDRGDWLLSEHEPRYVVLNPLARIQEIRFAGPQFGKFAWFIVRAAVDCYPWVLPDAKTNLRGIVQEIEEIHEDDLIGSLRHTLDELQT
jgi:hypothetical protein